MGGSHAGVGEGSPGPAVRRAPIAVGLTVALLGAFAVAVAWSLGVTSAGLHSRDGWSALRTGHYSAAVREFEAALNSALDVPKPGYDPALNRLGLSYAYLARRDFARAAAVLPPGGSLQPWVALQRGLVAAAAGDRERAAAVWSALAARGDLPPRVQRSALWHLAQLAWPAVGDPLRALASMPAARDPYVAAANLRLAQALAPSDEAAARRHLALARAHLPLDDGALATPDLNLGRGMGEGLPQPLLLESIRRLEHDLAEAGLLRAGGAGSTTLDAFWGRSFAQQEEWELAREILSRVIAAQPGVADLHSYLGLALQRLGRPEAAERELVEAVRLDPSRVLGHHLLARLYNEQQRWDEARPHLEEALHAEPNSVVLHLDLAAWYEGQGNYIQAEAEYTQAEQLQLALRTAPGVNASLRLASFYLERNFALGGCELSREAARRALDYNPGAGEYDVLGWAQHLCRNREEALAALRMAIELDTGSARAHYHLGVVLKETGQRGLALRHLELAQDLDPGGIWERRALAAIVGP